MFLPYGDEPNPEGFTPWVTWLLIAANCAIFFLITVPATDAPLVWSAAGGDAYLEYSYLKGLPSQQTAYDLIVFNHGFRMAAFNPNDILTSLFLHGGLMHLFGNMLFLYIYADNIEHHFGHLNFLWIYLLGGAASCVIYGLWAADPTVPLIGASGAISAVLGLYWILFPNHRIKFFVALFPFYVGRLQLSARWVLLFYLVAENLLPKLLGSGGSVAYGAHLGGFAAGVVCAFLIPKLARDEITYS